jgi:3-oxoacyl-[acyl-carrier protein] reductase
MANTRLDQIQSHLGPNGLEMDPTRVDGHVIIITGAAQGKIHKLIKVYSEYSRIAGIGRSAAILLAQRGAKVAINDLDSEKAADVVREIRSLGRIAEAFPGDALDEKFPDQLITRVLAKWGKINCLINNAGMPIPHSILRKRHANRFQGSVMIVPFTKCRTPNLTL